MLFVQTNCGLSAIVGLVKEPEKLPVIFPIPTGVVHVSEAFVFDFAADLIECRKQAGGGRTFGSQPLFFGQPQGPNAGENLQPRQKKPAGRPRNPPARISGDEINRQEGSDQDSKRSEFLRERSLIAAQRDTENSNAEGEKKPEQHLRFDLMLL